LEPVFEPEEAWQPGAPIIHDQPDSVGIYDAKRNIAAHLELNVGNPDRGFQESDIVMEREYRTQFAQHCAIEPHITICSSTKTTASSSD